MINEANPSVYSGSTTAKVQWFPVDPLEGAGSCGHPEDAFTSQCLWSFFFFVALLMSSSFVKTSQETSRMWTIGVASSWLKVFPLLVLAAWVLPKLLGGREAPLKCAVS